MCPLKFLHRRLIMNTSHYPDLISLPPILDFEASSLSDTSYPSSTALRMAVCRKTSPVTVFSFPHRHNKFALSLEIAKWLLKQRLKNCAHPLQFVAEVPKALLRDYGVVLHERDIIEIMGVDNRDQLREYFLKDVLPFPIFTIDHRQTKLFALACEVPIHLSSL